jgi:hypothetical protein
VKTIHSLIALALVVPLASSSDALAQPGRGGGGFYNQPNNTQLAGGFWNRQGRLIFGGNLGLGGMEDNGGDIECANCNAISGQGAAHIGGFVGPRLALMGEVQGNIQTLSSNTRDGTDTLVQSTLMFAGQYWVTPQLWIKGGIGFSNLRVDRSYYNDNITDVTFEIPENGFALMGAAGFELLSSQHFSVDLQGRLLNASYDQANYHITALSVGVGLNWY